MRVFVPTRVTHAGYLRLAVHRGGRSRVVAFENFEMAQRAVDVVAGGEDLIHVVAGLLTYPISAGHASDGDLIVHELTVDKLADTHVDLCEFYGPNFVDLVGIVEAEDAASGDERARLEGLFELES